MRYRQLLLGLFLGLTLLILPDSASGQRLKDGQQQFEGSQAYRSSRILRNQLRKGEVTADPKDKEHIVAVEIMAKDTIYPIFWITDQASFTPRELNTAVENFAALLSYLSRDKVRAGTATLQQMLCRRATDLCKEIFQHPDSKPIAKINAAILLYRITERQIDRRSALQSVKEWVEEVAPRLADDNADHLATVCLTLLQEQIKADADPRLFNDGAKYYLFRALSSLLAIPVKTPPKPATVEKIIQTALDFVATKRAFAKNASREELEGYKVLRREAVKVIAQAKTATVGKSQPGLILARFAGNDSRISPPPRLDERMEAAIGLARLIGEAAKSPGFQADYAAAQVGRTIQAFGVAADANIERKGAEKLLRARPWMVDAARLNDAITLMKGDGKNKYVADVARQCAGILSKIEQGNSRSGASDLRDWLDRNAPTSKALDAQNPESTVKPIVEKES